MNTLEDLKKEYTDLKNSLTFFEKNLPKGFVISNGEVVEDKKQLVLTVYSDETTYLANESKNFKNEIWGKVIVLDVDSPEDIFKDMTNLLNLYLDQPFKEIQVSSTVGRKVFDRYLNHSIKYNKTGVSFLNNFVTALSNLDFKAGSIAEKCVTDSEEDPLPKEDIEFYCTENRISLYKESITEDDYEEYHCIHLEYLTLIELKEKQKKFEKQTSSVL